MNMYTAIANGIANERSHLALHRSYFTARNPTPGTGIASKDAAIARDPLVANMTLFNDSKDNSSFDPRIIIPVRLRIEARSVNTTASDLFAAFYTDEVVRRASGGTAITEVPSVNSAEVGYATPTSAATIYFGEIVCAAASTEVKHFTEEISTTILKADDTFDFWFGDAPGLVNQVGATGYKETTTWVVPPLWILPGASMLFQSWGTAQAADPAFAFEFSYLDHKI